MWVSRIYCHFARCLVRSMVSPKDKYANMSASIYRENVHMTKEYRTQKARISQPEAARLYNRLAKVYDLWGLLTETGARNRALELAAVHDGQQKIIGGAVGNVRRQ